MTLLRFLVLFYALFVIFVSGGLFFSKSGWASYTLAFFGILLGLEIFDFLYATSRFVEFFPEFYGIYHFPAGFLYGPALWFHFQFFLKPYYQVKWIHLINFFPFLVVVIIMSNIFMMPGVARIDFIDRNFMEIIMPINYFRSWHILFYGVAILIFIVVEYSESDLKRRIYSVSVCAAYFLTASLLSWLVGFADNWRQFIFYYLLTAPVVFAVGFIIYRNPFFLVHSGKKYVNSGLNRLDMVLISEKINRSLSVNKVYLHKGFTLQDLANEIGEKPHRISQTLSELMNVSFSDLINRYRVDHAKELLADPTFGHYKIEVIAMESGFNNKVSFHKAFQKFANATPAAFRPNIGV